MPLILDRSVDVKQHLLGCKDRGDVPLGVHMTHLSSLLQIQSTLSSIMHLGHLRRSWNAQKLEVSGDVNALDDGIGVVGTRATEE